jgi:hypothetical protein
MRININKVTLNSVRRGCFVNLGDNSFTEDEKSDLIYRILAGIPLPVIVTEEVENKFCVLSEKDIVLTILQFIQGDFVARKNELLSQLIEESIEGKTFNDFSEPLKEKFLETQVIIGVYRPLCSSERDILISALSKEKQPHNTTVTVYSPDAAEVCSGQVQEGQQTIEGYINHPFFAKINAVPGTDVVIPLMMITKEGVSCNLSSQNINEFKEAMECVPNIRRELDYLNSAYTEKTNYLKKAHLPMIFICARDAINDGLDPAEFKNVIDSFFATIIPEYKKASDNGTASKANVNTRTRIMLEFYNKATHKKT